MTRSPRNGLSDTVTQLIVVIPAHDERDLIAGSLDSVLNAREAIAGRAACLLVVVADRCSDDTAAVAAAMLRGVPSAVVHSQAGRAGSARKLGVAHGLTETCQPWPRTWIASTDADTHVPEDWLGHQLSIAQAGFDGVTGVVSLASDGDSLRSLRRRFADYYRIEPDGSHGHVHAANMGIRANAYQSVGGWADMATGEDHDIWRRLGDQGWRTRSSAKLTVATSARIRARAPHGFAADIAALLVPRSGDQPSMAASI